MISRFKIKMGVLFIFMIFVIAGLPAPVVMALTTQEILKKADEARGGNFDGLEWEMVIDTVEKGRPRQRTLQVTLRGYDAVVEFLTPAETKGMKLLVVDRNMWFSKPGLSMPVAISARQKLAGGAAGGDIAATNYVADYRVIHEAEEVLSGEPCYLYDLSAIEKKVTYERIKYWISKERLVGLKAEFYTVSGKLFKTALFEYDNRVFVQGQNRPFISKMTITGALLKDDVTIMTYRKPVLKKVPDEMFHLNLPVKKPEEKDNR
ncbi:MAG: outer membrane lipoprotein-sorting protein [Desulfobacteraceae bacterium]|nr:MAG: outer membrane lipoprotein-sorting protein [Desulfobacteraceae bacterium]